jgi:hypothetical protein
MSILVKRGPNSVGPTAIVLTRMPIGASSKDQAGVKYSRAALLAP